MKHYDKARYIHEINEMLEQCNDHSLLHLIWMLLRKMEGGEAV